MLTSKVLKSFLSSRIRLYYLLVIALMLIFGIGGYILEMVDLASRGLAWAVFGATNMIIFIILLYRVEYLLRKDQIAIAERESRYRLLAENSTDVITQNSPQGVILYISPSCRELMGYEPEELTGRSAYEVMHPDDVIGILSRFANSVLQNDNFRLVYRLQHKSGHYVWVESTIRTVFSNTGELVEIITNTRDISERRQIDAELRENEARFRTLFEETPIALLEEDFSPIKAYFDGLRAAGVVDFEAHLDEHPEDIPDLLQQIKVLDVNKATLKMYHAEHKQQILGNLSPQYTANEFEGHKRGFLAIAQGRLTFEHKLINYTADMQTLHMIMRWAVLPGYEDTYAKVLISIVDVTELKAIENQLRESEARYRVLFEESPVALWEEDFSELKTHLDKLRCQHGDLARYLDDNPDEITHALSLVKIIDMNKAALKLYKAQSKEQLLGSLAQTENIQSLEVDKQALMVIADNALQHQHEVKNHTLEGDPLFVTLSWAVVPGYEATYGKVLVSIVDLSQRKHAEEALRLSNERFSRIAENIQEVLYLYDPVNDRIIYTSPMYQRLFGIDHTHFIQSIHPDDRERIVNQMVNGRFQPFDAEYRIVRPDGEVRWVWARDFPIRNEAGEIYLFTGVVNDITERKQTEEQRMELALEREKVLLLANFVRDASHDFRTPLSILLTSLHLLKRVEDRDKWLSRIEVMEEQVMRLHRLIDQLLTMSRLDSSPEQASKNVNVNHLIRLIENVKRKPIEDDGVTLLLDLSPELPLIKADSIQMHLAFNNLIENAHQYTLPGGTIAVRSFAGDDAVMVEIQDTGIGIEPEHLPFIFDRFYRTDKARSTRTGGIGLGLSIVKKIIDLHEGRIEVESAVNQGSTFRIILPLHRVEINPALPSHAQSR